MFARAALDASDHGEMARKKIVQQVEGLTQRFADAINGRDFDLSSPAWDNIAEGFQAEAEYPQQPRKLELPELFEMLRPLTAVFPDYILRLKEMTTMVYDKTGHAEVFMKVEVVNAPPGVTKQGVGILIYRQIEDKWWLVEHRTAAGMDMTGQA